MIDQKEVVLARMATMRRTIDGFENSFLKRLFKQYDATLDDLLGSLHKIKGTWTKERQLALIGEVNIALTEIAKKLEDPIAQATAEAGAFSYKQMNAITSWDGKAPGFNFLSLSPSQIAAMAVEQTVGGKLLKDWIGDSLISNLDEIKNEILKGYIKGESAQKIVAKLNRALKGKASKRNLESIVRTYIQSINVKAQQDIYEANKDIVKKVEWTAIMENSNSRTGKGTCVRCAALDGMRWRTDDYSRPSCPLHVRCRCMLLPITKTWKELGFDVDEMEDEYVPWVERDKRGKIIDYGTTDKDYADFWNSKPKAWQDLAIGPRRANLIRDGFIDFDDMVVANTAYMNLLNKYGNAKYILGDKVLLADLKKFGGVPIKPKGGVTPPLKPKPKPKPKPSFRIKPRPKPKKKPVVSKPVIPIKTANEWYEGLHPSMRTKYQNKALLADGAYNIKRLTGKDGGSYYWAAYNYINMDINAIKGSIRAASTFVHEFGHRTDHYLALMTDLLKKWGGMKWGLYGKGLSKSTKYMDAVHNDLLNMTTLERESYKKMGGKGASSSLKTWRLREEILTKEKALYGEVDIDELAILVEKDARKNITKVMQPFLDFTDDTFKELKSLGFTHDQLVSARASAYFNIAVASKYKGSMTFMLENWLQAFRSLDFHKDFSGKYLYLADAIGGTTKNKYGYGHTNGYYREIKGRNAAEAFANLFLLYGEKNATKILKMFMPNQYRLFKQVVKELEK